MSDDREEIPAVLRGRLPVRIVLRQVKIPVNAKHGEAKWLWDALEEDVRNLLENSMTGRGVQASKVVHALCHRLNQESGGLLLLDGLDEVPAANKRRTYLLQAIRQLLESLPKTTRVLVTARPYAYTDPSWRLADFIPFFLTPFDKGQRKQFIDGWYKAARERFGLREEDLKQRIPDLLERIEGREHLRELARRPLLLTLIATLHASGGRLPDDRAQLYNDSVDLLLYQWRADRCFRNSDGNPLRLDESDLRKSLQQLAWVAHKAQRGQEESNGTANISRGQLLEAFEPILDTLGRDDLLAFLEQHSGILINRGAGYYAFPHRSFQEYLAMGWLTSQSDDALSQEVCIDPVWWRETFLLAVLEQSKKPIFAMTHIKNILEMAKDADENIHRQAAVLAGIGLIELRLTGLGGAAFSSEREGIRLKLIDIIETPQALTIVERAEAGRGIGASG